MPQRGLEIANYYWKGYASHTLLQFEPVLSALLNGEKRLLSRVASRECPS